MYRIIYPADVGYEKEDLELGEKMGLKPEPVIGEEGESHHSYGRRTFMPPAIIKK